MTTTLFVNGTIRTDGSSEAPWLLIEGERVRALGRTSDDRPAADRVVDLDGGTIGPAFCDAHVHLPATGLYEVGMDFRGETSAQKILASYRQRASTDRDAPLFGGNFEDPLDAALGAADLDHATSGGDALLMRADMHSCIVSTKVLERLDLGAVEGVDRDPDGAPTGYLREQAASEAYKWFESSMDERQQIDAIRAAVRKAYSKGVATVHEMFVIEWRGWASYEVFSRAIEPVALHVLEYLGTDEVARVAALGLGRIGGDYFLDGSFGSHTAWLEEPYLETPPAGSPARGIAYRDDENLYAFFLGAQRARLQVGVHAIGDAAIRQCLDTWERVARDVGSDAVRSLGHRIEHFECATDDHIRRAAALGIRASVQPAFDAYWGGRDALYSRRIGWERAAVMNRFGSMARAGLEVGAGSDSTVTPLDPLLQMKALRLHHVEEERVDAATALRMHTLGGHLLSGEAEHRGTLAAGAFADLVWLDRDPVTTDPQVLLDSEVVGTWVEGQQVWPPERAEAA